jgi:hypothetical protein
MPSDHDLNEIISIARVLVIALPEAAKNYRREARNLAECKNSPDLERWAKDTQHEMNCYLEQYKESVAEMGRLYLLCRKAIPDLRLEIVRISPFWDYEDETIDWKHVVWEIQQIAKAANRKLKLCE